MPESDPRPTPESPIVRFYRGTGRDSRGRSLDEVLGWDDEALEAVHDFVQWLFPLDEPSMFNPHAPLLRPADCEAFRRDSTLTANLRRAFDRMLAFYGFERRESGGSVRVERSSDWSTRAAVWVHAGNHNHLRLTRVMKSLILLGQPHLARALYKRLRAEAESAGPGRISAVTLTYWEEAVR